MEARSLVCGDCGAQLKNAQEAQEHAEVSGHANFSESVEAVLNLVCTTCGKPCRTKTESELHTKRTGHTDFDDKTNEASKPIDLAPSASGEGKDQEMVDASGEKELVVPDVNKEILAELEGMGFPTARATRALHFSGNSSIEDAVNWIVENENDPEFDTLPMVPKSAGAEDEKSAKQALTPEQVKARAQELRERARKKKEEEEKRMEREREKERIRIGKELLEAKRIEEENERKRLLALRKAEKEEEKQAREKIRQKLEEDKAERRRKLGLPPEDPNKAKPQEPVVEETKSSLPVRPATKAEQLRDCLRQLKQEHKDENDKVKRAYQTLLTYIGNVAKNPNEEKFRKIRLSNPSFQERVGNLKGGIEFLELCGFIKEQGGEFLVLLKEKVDMMVLRSAGGELNSAITNPFFGVL